MSLYISVMYIKMLHFIKFATIVGEGVEYDEDP